MCVVLYVLCLYVCFDICIRDTPTFTASCTVVSTTCVCVCVCIEMEKKKKKKKKNDVVYTRKQTVCMLV